MSWAAALGFTAALVVVGGALACVVGSALADAREEVERRHELAEARRRRELGQIVELALQDPRLRARLEAVGIAVPPHERQYVRQLRDGRRVVLSPEARR